LDYELFEELRVYITNTLEGKKNPKEVLKTLTALIEYVADCYLDEN
jgi:hypothetical protein